MGNSYGGYFSPGAPKKDGTTLVELQIAKLADAHFIVGESIDGAFTPVSLVPQKSMATCCCCVPMCYVSIPHGFSAIVSKFGAVVDGDEEEGTWSSGCHCFSPLNNVDRLVSRQLMVFDTPIKGCKTKDAITVNIDVLVVFEIVKAKDFVYSIGPEKFDDLLRASQDEALRQMAFEITVEKVHDLRGTNTQHIIDEMNTKFERYGVKVHHFTVKNVTLPREMANDFEEKTLFESKTTMQHMKQSFDRLKLNNDEGKQKLREECDNAEMASGQNAEVIQNQAVKETAQVEAQTKKDIAELQADWQLKEQKVMNDAELEVSKKKAEILAVQREAKSKTEADRGRILAEAEAFAKQKHTQGEVEKAAKLANGKRALGEAEGEASAAFAARRAHEAEMKRLDILEKMTMKKGVQIATSQENTMGISEDNSVVTSVAQQGLEAFRAKLAEMTAGSLAKLEAAPGQSRMAIQR
jgi:regulator of protease activity HflC (stomatin/prohibitin superfamily)